MVYWDGRQDVMIKVTEKYKSGYAHRLMGLCGSYDGNPNNDLVDISNKDYSLDEIIDFAHQWKTDPDCVSSSHGHTGCYHAPGKTEEQGYRAVERACSVLEGKSFEACHAAIPYKPFKIMCMRDLCACNYTKREDCMCDALSLYARVCAWYGGKIELSWRTDKLCRKYSEVKKYD